MALATIFSPAEPLAQPIAADALPESAPAVAIGDLPVVAWLSSSQAGARVRAVAPIDRPSIMLGPGDAGSDGPPSASAGVDGTVWVVAARHQDGRARLWTQRLVGRRWLAAEAGPDARGADHHPVVVAGRRSTWISWVGDTKRGSGSRTTLYAARWNDGSWQPPEVIWRARSHVQSGAPTIALDNHDNPLVAWAAAPASATGESALPEIWASQRIQTGNNSGAWSSPARLSSNHVPDILPSATFARGAWLVSWVSYSDAGYLPVASLAHRAPASALATSTSTLEWSRPQSLSDEPGSAPRALASAGRPTVVWARPQTTPHSATTLRAARWTGQGWSAVADIGQAYNARFGVTTTQTRALLAWFENGSLRAAEGSDRGVRGRRHRGFALDSIELAASNAAVPVSADSAAINIELPARFRGMGDSITEGVYQVGGTRLVGEGYFLKLAKLLAAFLGKPQSLVNDSRGGEITSEGVSRLRGLLGDHADITMIMHGTNDIMQLIDPATINFNVKLMMNDTIAAGSFPVISNLIPVLGRFFGLKSRVDTFNSLIANSVRMRGALLADNFSSFHNRSDLFSDELHPTPAGYDEMGTNWMAGMQLLLSVLLEQQDEESDLERDQVVNPNPSPGETIDQLKLPGCC